MKRTAYILVFLISLMTASECAYSLSVQKIKTPEIIIRALDSLYPNAKEVQWSKRRRKFTADFIYNKVTVSVTFNDDGEIIESFEEIDFEALPLKVKEKINSFYKTYKVVMVIQHHHKNRLEYDVQIIKGQYHYILNYNRTGFLMHEYEVDKVDWATQSIN